MSISFQNSFSGINIGTTSYQKTPQTAVQKVQAAGGEPAKSLRTAKITEQTGIDRPENDTALRKMRFAKTKQEALSEYFGSMQEALRDSGSKGADAVRRVGNLIETGEAFKASRVYQEKKDEDNFVVEQIEAMQKKQEEMAELRADAEEREAQKASQSAENASVQSEKTISDENALRSSSNKIAKTAGTTANQTGAQQSAAKLYKVNDNPARQLPTDLFTGQI